MLKRSLSLLVFVCGLAAVFGILLAGSPAQAQTTYYWTTAAGTMTPGNGTWDTATPNWSTTTTGDATLSAWSGSLTDAAYFYANSSPTFTITVNGNQNVSSIAFAGSGYTITGGQLTLGVGNIWADANATISSNITGTNGLSMYGNAQLTLSGNNTYTGSAPGSDNGEPTVVWSGTLAATTNTAIPIAPGVDVEGGMLKLSMGGASGFTAANVDAMVGSSSPESGLDGGALGLDTTGGNIVYNYSLPAYGPTVKFGPNTLLLTAGQGYTYNSLTVAGGAVQLGNANALFAAPVTVTAAGGLAFSSGITNFNVGGLNGSGNLALADTNGIPIDLVITGGNSSFYSGVMSAQAP